MPSPGSGPRSGRAPKPDIGTVEAFKRALGNAKSIAYSDSVSGAYISTVLYPKLGVSDAVRAKSRMILADPVGGVVANGEAELGFQQISELLPVKGIDVVGPIPAEIQKVTLYSAGVAGETARGGRRAGGVPVLAGGGGHRAARGPGPARGGPVSGMSGGTTRQARALQVSGRPMLVACLARREPEAALTR